MSNQEGGAFLTRMPDNILFGGANSKALILPDNWSEEDNDWIKQREQLNEFNEQISDFFPESRNKIKVYISFEFGCSWRRMCRMAPIFHTYISISSDNLKMTPKHQLAPGQTESDYHRIDESNYKYDVNGLPGGAEHVYSWSPPIRLYIGYFPEEPPGGVDDIKDYDRFLKETLEEYFKEYNIVSNNCQNFVHDALQELKNYYREGKFKPIEKHGGLSLKTMLDIDIRQMPSRIAEFINIFLPMKNKDRSKKTSKNVLKVGFSSAEIFSALWFMGGSIVYTLILAAAVAHVIGFINPLDTMKSFYNRMRHNKALSKEAFTAETEGIEPEPEDEKETLLGINESIEVSDDNIKAGFNNKSKKRRSKKKRSKRRKTRKRKKHTRRR